MELVRFNIGGYDDSKVFEGFDAGRWNGWLIPAVTKEVWEDVIAWQKSLLTEEEEGLEEIIEDLESVEPNQEGLYLIGCGLVWDIVEEDIEQWEAFKEVHVNKLTEYEKLKLSIKAEVDTGLMTKNGAIKLAKMIDAGIFDDDINGCGWEVMNAIDQIDEIIGMARIHGWEDC
tara:strand:- start:348 stop:866 length:519 start_codon:yes stop_codon:yes gene_type:complete